MTHQDRRQCRRVIRSAREVENLLSYLIEELQDASKDENAPYDWHETKDYLVMIGQRMPILVGLVENSIRAQEDQE